MHTLTSTPAFLFMLSLGLSGQIQAQPGINLGAEADAQVALKAERSEIMEQAGVDAETHRETELTSPGPLPPPNVQADNANEATAAEKDAAATVELAAKAAAVLETQRAQAPNERIPAGLLQQAKCIAVFPSIVKAGFILGAERGSGLISCRNEASGELGAGAPAIFNITSASIGLQAGVQSTRLILLIMDQKGVDSLLGGQFTLGSDVGVAAGPVGLERGISTLHSSILSYAHSEGLFAGVNLEGSTFGYAEDRNHNAYGEAVAAQELLFQRQQTPGSLTVFSEMLMEFTAQSGQNSGAGIPVEQTSSAETPIE